MSFINRGLDRWSPSTAPRDSERFAGVSGLLLTDRRTLIWLAGLLLVLAVGCSGEDQAIVGLQDVNTSGSDTNGDIAGSDTAATDTAGNDTASDTSEPVDTNGDPDSAGDSAGDTGNPDGAGGCPGAAGCACEDNSQCGKGFCLVTGAGKVCAPLCGPDCPEGHCLKVPGTDVSACIDPIGSQCFPCKASSECADVPGLAASCVANGDEGAFCAMPCNADAECLGGTTCQAANTAEGKAGSFCRPPATSEGKAAACTCSAWATSQALTTTCANSNDLGSCKGTRACGENGLTACSAPTPQAELCNGKDDDCDGQTDEGTDLCDDGKPCTTDSCDAKAGACTAVNLAAGTSCTDDDACTEAGACKDGACVGGTVACDDGNPCTADACDKALGCTHNAQSGSCEDGNACTNGDACSKGACVGGEVAPCDDGNPCTTESCDPTTAKCAAKPVDGACDDGNTCTEGDTCAAGTCGGKSIVCDDNNPCTTDSCDPKTGCGYEPNKAPCDDGNACTDFDLCNGGKCKGTAKDASDCDDGNPCTKDACDPKTGCTTTNTTGICDDGNPCTTNDACKGGSCTAGTVICACEQDSDCADQNPTNVCLGKLYCDKSSGTCKLNPATVVSCSSAGDTACAKNLCDPATGKCATTPVADGKACDADGSVCTSGDACKSGACAAGQTVGCDDGNPCTNDACDPTTGCTHSANSAPCDADGDACTTPDLCVDKVCTAGAKKSCDDGQLCTVDSCDKKTGLCVNDGAAMAGKACDADGTLCTGPDLCDAGTCKAGAALDCGDGNPCTDDVCDPKAGCVQVANVKPCDADGNACTVGDICSGKACVAGAAKSCDDNDACTKDACDPKTGACSQTPILGCNGNCAVDKDCDDGNSCTTALCNAKSGKCDVTQVSGACDDGTLCTKDEACAAGKCVGTKVDCSDNNPCTDDSCDAAAGCVHVNNSASCNDGDVCTANDTCANAKCAGAPKKCDDGDDCTKDSCNPGDGSCNAKPIAGCGGYCVTAADCDDKNVCTDESCTAGKCSSTTNTKACDDGDACTTKDACSGVTCTGVTTVCDDANPCSTDGCDAKTGACAYVALPKGVTCDDDSACTLGDTCTLVNNAIACVGKAQSCDDGNSCTNDSCDKAAGKCVATPIIGGPCDDGQPCTFGEACANGVCKTTTDDSVSTLAGNTAGFKNDVGAAALFNQPQDIEALGDGTFVVVDGNNHALRRVAVDGTVTTLAGTGAAGLGDGPAAQAQFNQPVGAAVDAKGAVYVVEWANHTVRKLASGTVTRLAGAGLAGLVEGPALSARFNAPTDIVVRSGGSMLVSDRNNHRIRVVDGGQVATLAGSVAGFVDGPAASARFNVPQGLAIGSDGSVYVADASNHRIRRISADLIVTTVAGSGVAGWLDGDATLARFNAPWGVATDNSGTIFVSDRSNQRVRRIFADKVTTAAGIASAGWVDGVATTARFNSPGGLAVEPGTGGLVLADTLNNRIRRVWAGGGQPWCVIGKSCVRAGLPDVKGSCQVCEPQTSTSQWTTLGNGTACSDALVCTVSETCTDGSCVGKTKACDDKDACTADSCDDGTGGCVFKPIVGCGGNCSKDSDCDDKNACTDDACTAGKCANTVTTKPCDDGDPCTYGDVCSGGECKSGNLTEVGTVAGLTAAGASDGKLDVATMNLPRSVVTGADGRLYVADGNNHRIRVIDVKAGTMVNFSGKGTAGMAEGTASEAMFNTPSDIDLRNDGKLVVTDISNHRLRLVDAKGGVMTWTGSVGGYLDGAADVARLNNPYGTALTVAGDAYVADYGNHRIRHVAADGSVTTLAGSTAGYADGKGAAAKFNYPIDVATLPGGGMVVADYANHRIRRITADGTVTTVAGSGVAGLVEGAAASARFYYPWGIGVDSIGRIFVADRYNQRVRVISASGSVSTLASIGGGYADGPATTVARFNNPWRFEVRPEGLILMADYANNRIRSIRESTDPCAIGGLCVVGGMVNPKQPCQICDRAKSAKDWTTVADGGDCQDGALCTVSDTCKNGSCAAGNALVCDDKIACTKDSCDTKTGACRFEVVIGCGAYCETDPQCDDGNPCTTDSCVNTKCSWINNNLPCNDGNSCTMGDVCDSGKCTAGKSTWVELLSGIGPGETDGASNLARFNTPSGVAWLPEGSVVVADRANHRLRKVSADGVAATLSGSVAGLIDGPAAGARYNTPVDVDADSTGRMVIADLGNQRIRLLDKGVVSSAAGSAQGFLDGPVSQARFSNPYGLAFSPGGAVYVADYSNNRVRRINLSAGNVVTVAGNGTAGWTDGTGASAVLNGPIALDVAKDGTIFVADYTGHRIRRITPAGQVTTVAGDGTAGYVAGQGLKARLYYPWGVLALPTGDVLVADSYNHRIRAISPDGNVTDFAGSGIAGYANGDAAGARLYYPRGLTAAPQGLVIIGDAGNHRIRTAQATEAPCKIGDICWSKGWPKADDSCQVCDASKDTTAFVAAADGAPCTDDKLCTKPDTCTKGVCGGSVVACDDKDVCTTDACDATTGACTFTKIIGCKGYCELAAHCDDKNPCTTDSCVNNLCQNAPNTATCDDGNPCTLGEHCQNGSCSGSTADTVVSTIAGSTVGWVDAPGTLASFNTPVGLAVDLTGTTWIADQSNHRIRRIALDGKVTTLAGSGNVGYLDGDGAKAWFNYPSDVEVRADGAIAVADRYNNRVRIVAPDGTVSTLAGEGTAGATDGPAQTATLNQPMGIARSGQSFLVADFGSQRIRVIAADGSVSTLAGSTSGYKDAKGTAAQFQSPIGIAVDSQGVAYVTEWDGHRVRRIAADGTVTTLSGSSAGFLDGGTATARYNRPWGIDVDESGRIWVADYGNSRLRLLQSGLVVTAAGIGAGYVDGSKAVARFNTLRGVAVLPNGNVVVGDTGNARIRLVQPTTDACSIGGKCYSDGTVNPSKSCEICAGAKSSAQWQTGGCSP